MRLPNFNAAVLLSTIHFVNSLANPDVLPDLDQGMLRGRAPEPTAGPLLRHARDKIFARQTQNAETCGFLNGDISASLYCSAGYGCAYFTTDVGPQGFECCQTLSTGGIDFNTATCFAISQCEPFASHSYTFSYATSYTGTEYCGSAAPYCGVTYLDASESLSGSFTHFNCETEAGLTSTAYDVVIGGITTPSSSIYTTPPSPISTPTTSGSSSTSTSSTTSTSPSPTPTESHHSSSSNTGAIAGGVVGGVAGVAIIGAIIGWLVWRKRQHRRDADVPEVSVLPSK